MKELNEYKTKQKDLIVKTIKRQKKEFTVKDIYDDLKEIVGLTTIYRMVDKLVENDILIKTIGTDNTTYYQYLEQCQKDNHFYLKCDKCGCMEHIDCDCINDLSNHILKNHKFKLSKKQIIINGLCKKCEDN